MKTRCTLLIAVLLTPSMLSATDLNQETLKAWDAYIQETNLRMQQRLSGDAGFFWMDEAPGRRERILHGEILVEPAKKEMPEKVPQGLIHDWIGAVFIPNATIDAVFAVLDDYGRYNQFYNPAVINAKLLDDSGGTRRFSVVLVDRMPFVTAAIKSEYSSRTIRLSEHDWYTISYSTRIQQIDNYGQAGEHELSPDKGSGYVWRLYSIEKFEERDGGVYAELEAIALSRNIPFELQWLVKPILRHLPRNSMIETLQKTRDAVCAERNPIPLDLAKLGRGKGNSGTGGAATPDDTDFGVRQKPSRISFGPHAPN